MDAKPQRPLRALPAVPGNENILPEKQHIHQRHKSVGNLKAMATAGALNAPPKRTAFGDVSNTARTLMAEPTGKNAVKTRVKSIAAAASARDLRLEDKENGQVARSDNRSRNTTASKATGNGNGTKFRGTITSSKTSGQAAKPALRVNNSTQQRSTASLANPPLRNGASKKVTTIYHDRKGQKTAVRPDAPSPADDLAALVAKPAKNPRHPKSQPVLRAEQQSKFVVKTDDLVETDGEGDVDDDATDAAYEDAVERLSQDVDYAIRQQLDREQAYSVDCARNPPPAQDPESPRLSKPLPELPAASEEEYWDEEEEEQELYEEPGYTTAHSCRSLGDNSTGGPTTIVAPNVTAEVRRELEKAKAYVLEHQTEEEVEEEAWDVSMVAEYGEEIFTYMKELEANMLPDPHYMDIQTEIQWSMRSVLMDWLVQVHHRFCLLPETLFLTTNYIDRFLSVKVVSLGKLQLVGATALFVAAKYEEINCPSVQEIVYMVDSGYTADEIIKAERFMLSMLQFELGWPGPMSFLRRISKADDYDLETRTLAKYFLEITIMDERFVGSPPSFIAAGAHCISRLFLDKGDWTPAHVHYSGYTLSQLKPLIQTIFECCHDPRKHHGAVFEKYSSPKYKQSATFVEDKITSGVTLSQLYAASSRTTSSSHFDDDLCGPYTAPRNPIPING
ncbi:G2/mitotic-specific cyclin-4 [Madurella mycetomatis]|uniref:G2/mitotic-specific cyclin-4 n=1 Tax=Madurella mycetomatis TaxID=100816 RepID=A0A175VZ84_9PEZI|nr:G2/mitotic-specific cyclin-4 [Madurella mycetomatis]